MIKAIVTQQSVTEITMRKTDSNALDFVVNRFFMKLFQTSNIDTASSVTVDDKSSISSAVALLL